jgi:hypothetical protein
MGRMLGDIREVNEYDKIQGEGTLHVFSGNGRGSGEGMKEDTVLTSFRGAEEFFDGASGVKPIAAFRSDIVLVTKFSDT